MKILYVSTISNTINAFMIPHIELLLDQGYKVDIACNVEKEINEEVNTIKELEIGLHLANTKNGFYLVDFREGTTVDLTFFRNKTYNNEIFTIQQITLEDDLGVEDLISLLDMDPSKKEAD